MLVSGINVRGQSPFGDGANITKRIHIKSEESANHVIFEYSAVVRPLIRTSGTARP